MQSHILLFQLLLSGWLCFALEFEYHSEESLQSFLSNVTQRYPNLAKVYSIGKSARGRDLEVMKISAAPDKQLGVPNVKLIGNMHGNEPLGRELILHLIEFLVSNYARNVTVQRLLNNTRLHLLPSLNPDGFNKSKFSECTPDDGARNNWYGYDLNRNFPDYFHTNKKIVQRETQAVMEWMKKTPFVLSASLHGGAVVAIYPFHDKADVTVGPFEGNSSKTADDDVFQHIAKLYSSTHPTMHKGERCPGEKDIFPGGIINGAAWKRSPGTMQDYNYVWHGCLELTLELSCCKYPRKEDLPRFWQQNKEALLRYMAEAQRGVQGLILDCETNTTIPGAKLFIKDRELPFNSSQNGEYWRILLPGTYTITVTAEGYQAHSISFKVLPPMNSTRLDIYLMKNTSKDTCSRYQLPTTKFIEPPTTSKEEITSEVPHPGNRGWNMSAVTLPSLLLWLCVLHKTVSILSSRSM